MYRTFAAFLGPDATTQDLTPGAVRAYRDALEQTRRSPGTVAKHLSALRGLADAAMKTCAPRGSQGASRAR